MLIKKKSIICIMLCLCILTASGCYEGLAVSKKTPDTASEEYDSLSFSELMDEIFAQEVSSDLLTLNYSLAQPENYGIYSYNKNYGDTDLQNLGDDSEITSLLSKLKEYDYDTLTSDEKLTYDILKDYLETELEYSDLYLYAKTLSPTIGLTCQLPVVLAEFSFRKAQDVYDYIELLNSTGEYFDYILEIEKQKSDAGLFMTDEVADQIIEQADNFTCDPDNNFLIEVFNEKIDAMDCFSDIEKESLKEQNADAVKNNVICAYSSLAQGLAALKGTGKYEGGLCNYPEGDRYYEYLVKSGTGSDREISEIEDLIDTYMLKAYGSISTAVILNPDIYEKACNTTFELTDPYEILEDLKVRIASEFPQLPDTSYTIKYVPESLGDHLSPAFYMVPAFDDYTDNSIYINEYCSDSSDIYTTLAHEGFPGHLYQSVYTNSKITSPIRSILNYPGYTEGWATYVELLSYEMGAIDEDIGKILSSNQMMVLCVYAKCDIGINYHGWSKSDLESYITDIFGDAGREAVDEIYIAMVSEPANYLKYVVGCLEFMELKNTACEKLGDAFNSVEFHDFLLSTGPAPFAIISSRMESWITKQLNTIRK
jgi:uncharacterized protein (DUF885 family)